jgi:regulator of cell morphogenesis and NO signaling
MIDANQTLGHIATPPPASTLVFQRHRLDFCCGGGRKLGDACLSVGLNPDKVIDEISAESAVISQERWGDRPLPELIDFILSRFHEPLRVDLPALIATTKQVEQVHGEKPNYPRGLASLLEQINEEVRRHMDKEEQVLFPAIQAGNRGANLHAPIRVLIQEHEAHGAQLLRVRKLTSDFRPPAEACASWRALYIGLAKLEADLMEHVHLENNVLFPRALNA